HAVTWDNRGIKTITLKVSNANDVNACPAELQRIVWVDAGLSTGNLAEESLLKIYPNPARISEELMVETGMEGETRLELVSASGAVLKKQVFNGKTQLSLDGLQPGFYLVRVDGPQGLSTRKLVIR